MLDPRFHFYRKYGIHPNAVLNFFFLQAIKMKKKPNKYGLYKMVWNYIRNAYNKPDIKYHQVYYFIRQYQKFRKWLQKGKPIKTFE